MNTGRYALLALLLLLVAASASGWLSETAQRDSPDDHTIAQQGEDLVVNATFDGTGNVTLRYVNLSDGTSGFLHGQNGSLNFTYSWDFTTDFADGRYNLTLLVINSTNASDNSTITYENITIDQTPPTASGVRVSPNVTYAGVLYTNETPTFTTTLSDALAGIDQCKYAPTLESTFEPVSSYAGAAACSMYISGNSHGTQFNFSFLAIDKAGNVGANSTRLLVMVDSVPPRIAFNTPERTFITAGGTISISANISDPGVNITDGTRCLITIDGAERTSGTVTYSNTTGMCTGTLTIDDPSGLADGERILGLSINDSLNNSNTTQLTVIMDNLAPLVDLVSISERNPANDSVPVIITIDTTDVLSGISSVHLSNGTFLKQFSNITPASAVTRHRITFNLSEFNCRNESICALTIVANDSVNNTNSSVRLDTPSTLLFIDSHAPNMVLNGANSSAAQVGDSIRFFAKWADVSLLADLSLASRLEIYNATAGVFLRNQTGSHTGLETGNFTNFTYVIPGAAEGGILTARIWLNDTNLHANVTENLTLSVGNVSPNVTLSIGNNTFILGDGELVFSAMDVGIGSDLSTLSINVSGEEETIISYAQNASLFNCSCSTCGTAYAGYVETRTCSVRTQWPMRSFNLTFNVSDAVGNAGSTSYTLYGVQETPDIVNIMINGVQITNETPADLEIAFTNSSQLVNVTWTVVSTLPIEATVFELLNTSKVTSSSTVPVSALYNFTAGKNYASINLTVDPALFTDTVLMEITANIPLNLTAFRQRHLGGLITNVSVIAGTDITDTVDYINKTIDMTVTLTNGSNVVPFEAAVTYHDLYGLDLRWNATTAFDIGMDTALGDENHTIILYNDAPAAFFDGETPLTSVTFNLSKTNRSFYYFNGSRTRLLTSCAAVPVTSIGFADSCYMNTSTDVTLYLEHFIGGDEISVAQPPVAVPGIVNYTSKIQNNSFIPVNFTVQTAFPAAALCVYNVSRFNASNESEPYENGTIFLDDFTIPDTTWHHYREVYAPDGRYNVSINCSDEFGASSKMLFNVNITDTIRPTISDATYSGVTRDGAVITGTANENVTFTVRYSSNESDLNYTATQSGWSHDARITIEDLDPDTRYFFNLTACDLKGLCNTSATQMFRTMEPGTDGRAGGGGGGEAVPGLTSMEEMDARVLGLVRAGESVSYKTALAFSAIILEFSEETTGAKITVKQYNATPKGVPAAPGTVYKYLSIDHQNLKVGKHQLELSIEKKWLSERGVPEESIRLQRYEDGAWKEYRPVKTGATKDTIIYLVTVPGFSYFAITGTSAEPQAVIVPPQPPITTSDGSEPAVDKPAEFVSSLPERGKGIPSWILITIIVAIASVGTVVGLRQYQVYKVKESQHLEDIRSEGAHKRVMDAQLKAHERVAEHDPMWQLHNYITTQRAKGTPDDLIKQRLLSVGWDDFVVTMEMMRR